MAAAPAFLLDDHRPSSPLSIALGANNPPIDTGNFEKKLCDRSELANFQKQVQEDRAEQAEMAALIGQPVPEDLDADWLVRQAGRLGQKEREFSETLKPVIRALKKLLGRGSVLEPEVRQLVHDSAEILEAWPRLYRDLSNWFSKIAVERRSAGTVVLRARPVKDTVDYAKLSREHIARYPKIRARLAE